MDTIKTNTGSSGTTEMDQWSLPQLVQTIELQGSIELVYKQYSLASDSFGWSPAKVFKIIFSCVDGKWHKSEPIDGQIIYAQEESYDFL